MATLMLLGAGASFGSEPDRSLPTPPLGIDLFARLEELGRISASIPVHIKKVLQKDFEVGMGVLDKECQFFVQGFHRELCLYLSGFSPSDSNYYIELLRLVGNKNYIFASLNYDMMLEDAANILGLNYHYNVQGGVESVRVLKPHGSLNFWPDVPASMFVNCGFGGKGAVLDTTVTALTKARAIRRCTAETSLSPSISMYAKGKRVTICPAFVSRQQAFFTQACKSASRIIILGVKVIPEDRHIWEAIGNSPADIYYFGNEADEVLLRNWADNADRKNVNFSLGYFKECLSFISGLL